MMTDQHVGEPQDAPEDHFYDGNVDQLMTQANADGQTTGSRRRPKGLIIGGVAVVAAIVAVLITGAVFASTSGGTPAVQSAHESVDPTGALVADGYVEFSDDGETLFIDDPGTVGQVSIYAERSAVFAYMQRVLGELGAPDYVWKEMTQTRPLDGRQTADWDGYKVSWSYHPDDGLDVLITTAD